MPTSSSENKDFIKQWINDLNIVSVLDVGVGKGAYSHLMRRSGQIWTGVEAYYPYVAQYKLYTLYDKVIVADARYVDFDKLGGRFDLIICGDMIEHMWFAEAEALIKEFVSRSCYTLLCFPVFHLEQHDDNNPFETHIDHWSVERMKAFLDGQGLNYRYISGDILAYFLIKGRL